MDSIFHQQNQNDKNWKKKKGNIIRARNPKQNKIKKCKEGNIRGENQKKKKGIERKIDALNKGTSSSVAVDQSF
jgi:hypothetical protein